MGKHIEHRGIFPDIPCVKQMRADPMPTASMLEAIVGYYLVRAPQGIYFRGSTVPVMTPDGVYHQHKVVDKQKTKETFVVRKIEDIDPRMPVMDLDANVVISVTQIPFLSYIPPLPVTAIRIVEAAVKDVVDSHGMEEYRRNPRSPIDLYGDLILPETDESPDLYRLHQVPGYEKLDGTTRGAVIDQITEIVSGIRNDVKSFCGENPWVVHFMHRKHMDLIIEKSIDFRIIEYHNLTGTKLDYYE